MLKLGPFHRLGIALLGAAMVYGGPPVGVGYLPRIGPSPIRFQMVALRRTPAEALPPLQMTDEAAPVADDGTKATHENSTDPENAALNSNQPLGPEPASNFNWANSTNPVPDAFPQVLMHYFKGATNSEVFITTPVEFTPPGPPASRSSATYISK